MALKLAYPGFQPVGEFDALDHDAALFLGGEVVQLVYVSTTAGTDTHAADVEDGYVGMAVKTRPAVTLSLTSGVRPLMLADEGISGYGTLFGSLVGSSAGQSTNGGVIGPHTTAGSGKVTCWDKPGFYQVTLDAVDLTAATGLIPTNPTLAGNAALYATAAGKLTPNALVAFEAVVVGRFVEFQSSQSLVTTPPRLVSALNSPLSDLSTVIVNQFTQVLFSFTPEM